ncbi:amidohydrolase [Anoxynatronum sibiricum]|uniref:Amidohydrolase n=1 Tax=Anoxynatronum sibiricum TaxID=210623 RepID=A0ABU9VUY9_9CLOT
MKSLESLKWTETMKAEISELEQELIHLRRDFHQHPELGFEEHRTAGIVEKYLKDCGIVTRRVAETGVVGTLTGTQPEPVLMLRADMDALPIQETAEVSFRSVVDGKMHACGHDGHTAMLLVAAKILARHREKLAGTIKFVFQPNEEDAGAEILIEQGVMENPRVNAAMGLHLWSPLPTGTVGIIPGPLMASSYYFWIIIEGKGGHGGAPHLSKDPIYAANQLMNAVQAIQTRERNVLEPTLITFCQINAGTSPIIIPDEVTLSGSIRCLHGDDKQVRERFEQLVQQVCALYGTRGKVTFKCGNELLENDSAMAALVEQAAMAAAGEPMVIRHDLAVMLGEDFASFARRVPSAFYFVGIADAAQQTDLPHHHPSFKLDERVLPLGVEMHVRSAVAYFHQETEKAGD